MPAFPNPANSTTIAAAIASLGRGDSVYLFGTAPVIPNNPSVPIDDSNVLLETIVASTASGSVALIAHGGAPMLCIEIGFSAAPGTFEVDLQEADTNADAAFITPTNSAYTVNAVNATTQKARVDLSPTGGKFFRVFVKTLTNAVKMYVKVTRLA